MAAPTLPSSPALLTQSSGRIPTVREFVVDPRCISSAATVVPVLDGRTVEVASTTNVLHQLHVHGDRLDVGGGRGRRASAARRPLTRRRRALIFTEANPAIHLWRPSDGRVISSGWVARNPEIRAFARRRSLHDYDGQASAERVCSRPRLTTPMRDRVDRGAPVDLTCRAFVRGSVTGHRS